MVRQWEALRRVDDDEDPPEDRRAHIIARIVLLTMLFIALTLATIAQQLAMTNPVIAVVGSGTVALLTLLLARTEGIVKLEQWVLGLWAPLQAHARLVRWIAAGVIVIVVPGAVLVAPPLWRRAGDLLSPPPFADSCPHTAELRILTSPDSLAPTRELAESYARWTADHDDDQCPTVFPFVYAADSAARITAALARGWRADGIENPRVTVGPRPDVWLPDSTFEVRQVSDLVEAEHGPPVIGNVESIASSPMVLGLLGGVAAPTSASWFAQVAAQVTSGTPLLAPDPEVSTVGLLAAQAYLPAAPHGGVADPIVARQRAQLVLASGAAAGDDSATLLCRYRLEVPVTRVMPAAVLTSRQMWQRFVSGEPLGAGCLDTAGPRPGTATAPIATTVPVLDHPFVDFRWTEEPRRPVVAAFHDWLVSPTGRERLADINLDPARPECSVPRPNPCVPPNLDVSLDLYRRVKLPGRVLLALDGSGSMASIAAGRTRFDIAGHGVIEALGYVGVRDQLGLWVFPGGSGAWQELVAVGEGTRQHRDEIIARLGEVRPKGSTPLFPTVTAGLMAAAGPGTDTQARALVVLTDGEDTSGGDIKVVAQEVRRIGAATGVRLYIIATGNASCDAEDGSGLRTLTTAGNGRCFSTGPEGVPAIMAELFGFLWSGR